MERPMAEIRARHVAQTSTKGSENWPCHARVQTRAFAKLQRHNWGAVNIGEKALKEI